MPLPDNVILNNAEILLFAFESQMFPVVDEGRFSTLRNFQGEYSTGGVCCEVYRQLKPGSKSYWDGNWFIMSPGYCPYGIIPPFGVYSFFGLPEWPEKLCGKRDYPLGEIVSRLTNIVERLGNGLRHSRAC